MTKDNSVYVRHILDQIVNIEGFMEGVSEKALKQNLEKEYAVIRCFEIIGEASKKVDTAFKEKYTNIPWRKLAAFRDVLIHNYDRLVSEVIWETVKKDIPKLKKAITEILSNE